MYTLTDLCLPKPCNIHSASNQEANEVRDTIMNTLVISRDHSSLLRLTIQSTHRVYNEEKVKAKNQNNSLEWETRNQDLSIFYHFIFILLFKIILLFWLTSNACTFYGLQRNNHELYSQTWCLSHFYRTKQLVSNEVYLKM